MGTLGCVLNYLQSHREVVERFLCQIFLLFIAVFRLWYRCLTCRGGVDLLHSGRINLLLFRRLLSLC